MISKVSLRQLPIFTKLISSAAVRTIRREITVEQHRYLQTSAMSFRSERGPHINTTSMYQTVNGKSRINLEKDELEISLLDQDMKFNLTWLRDHCRCSECFDGESMQRLIDPSEFDSAKVSTNSIHISDDANQLVITWHDGHITLYHMDWLRRVYKLCTQPDEKFNQIFWDRDKLKSTLPLDVPFEKYMESDEGVVQFLKNLSECGVAFLSGVPTIRAMTRLIGERIAPLKMTIFNDVDFFPDTKGNLADRSYGQNALPFHTDYSSHEDPPGYVCMHYLLQADEGGETIISDAIRAARILRESQPEHFKALSTLPVTFHKIERGVFVRCDSTVFDVRGPNQDPIIVRTSNIDRSLLALSHTDAKKWYTAWRQFKAILEDPKSVYIFKGTPGRAFIFDNWRLTHGRLGYKGRRVLETANLSRDRVWSKFRTTAGINNNVIV